jgi:hypothetical protein
MTGDAVWSTAPLPGSSFIAVNGPFHLLSRMQPLTYNIHITAMTGDAVWSAAPPPGSSSLRLPQWLASADEKIATEPTLAVAFTAAAATQIRDFVCDAKQHGLEFYDTTVEEVRSTLIFVA